MRKNDILNLCFQNLMRHKSRAVLTVLGVVVGCCSIIIMVSLGLGMQKAQEQMLAEMGDLTMITVNSSSGQGARSPKLDDRAVKKIEQIPGVVMTAPKMSLGNYTVKVYAGDDRRYVTDYMSIAGMDADAMEQLGFNLLEGSYPKKSGDGALVGQYFSYSFQDTLRPEGSNIVDMFAMYNEDGTVGEAPEPLFGALTQNITIEVLDSKKNVAGSLKIKPTGRVKEDYTKAEESYQGIILTKEQMEGLLQEIMTKSGDAAPSREYSSISVKVEDLDQVAAIEKKIQGMGYRTFSMESVREPMRKEARQKQMMLGGLGAISLFVAAIGIMNTMVMSITERKREIGIMKSVGCYVKDIRVLFLLEAGCIGFMGGIIGIVISVAASIIMNRVSGSVMSVIPFWLMGGALLFSILIGVGSGYYPAGKAVKISALEAMKS